MSGLKFPKEETKKKRMSHPASILGSRKGRCYLCGRYTQTEEHHIFGGPNRTLSEQYGLKVDLCLECNQFGAHEVLVTVEYPDGTRITEATYTIDGKWKMIAKVLGGIVIAWKPFPEPYKEN